MDLSFILLAMVVVTGAVAAMSLRNLVHCALSAAGAFIGLAGLYLKLGAQFIGFAQVLVYVGAIAILVLFVILLTRGQTEAPGQRLSEGWAWGIMIPGSGFALVGLSMLFSRVLPASQNSALPPEVGVRAIGNLLMSRYVVALEAIGLLLTAALLGAVVLAMREKPVDDESGSTDRALKEAP